jgi:hypothetical protein
MPIPRPSVITARKRATKRPIAGLKVEERKVKVLSRKRARKLMLPSWQQ